MALRVAVHKPRAMGAFTRSTKSRVVREQAGPSLTYGQPQRVVAMRLYGLPGCTQVTRSIALVAIWVQLRVSRRRSPFRSRPLATGECLWRCLAETLGRLHPAPPDVRLLVRVLIQRRQRCQTQ